MNGKMAGQSIYCGMDMEGHREMSTICYRLDYVPGSSGFGATGGGRGLGFSTGRARPWLCGLVRNETRTDPPCPPAVMEKKT